MEQPVAASIRDVHVDKADLLESLKTIFAVFIDFFLHEQLTVPVPEFHTRVWNLMTRLDFKRVAIAIPRGHAKTTLAKLSAVWYFLFTDVQFIVYLSNTSDLAVKCVNDIMDFFDAPNFITVFGQIKYETEKRGDGEFIFYINTPWGGTKRCILKARGCGQQVRGLNIGNLRPQIAICDDMEDSEELDNEDVRNKNLRWFFGTFVKAMDRKFNKILMIGNLIDTHCILNKVMKLEGWTTMVLGAILKDRSPLWSDMWTIDALIKDYNEYQKLGLVSLWYAEMMNLIVAGETGLINIDEINYKEIPDYGSASHGFITIDPATGTGGNKTANGTLVPQVVDYEAGQLDESATVDTALLMAHKWGIRVIGIESIAYQRALATLFSVIMLQRGIIGIEVVKLYPGHASKNERIGAWVALIKTKGYAIPFGDIYITNQLLAYNRLKENNDDDLIDSCAMGPQMLAEYGGLIMSSNIVAMLQTKSIREGMLY
jgi:hypothetical protein